MYVGELLREEMLVQGLGRTAALDQSHEESETVMQSHLLPLRSPEAGVSCICTPVYLAFISSFMYLPFDFILGKGFGFSDVGFRLQGVGFGFRRRI